MSIGSVKLSGHPIFFKTQAEGRWECLECTWQSTRIIDSFAVMSDGESGSGSMAWFSNIPLLIPDEAFFRSS
jgi:hypothetical protein